MGRQQRESVAFVDPAQAAARFGPRADVHSLPTDERPSRFTDVAVTPQSILVLDGEGRRVYRVAKKGRTLELVARLAASDSSSLAPASDGSAYVAYDRGILRIDLIDARDDGRRASPADDLEELRWVRWHRGSLIAIQGALADRFDASHQAG